MSRDSSTPATMSRLVLCAAIAAGVSLASTYADAQSRGGGKPSAGSPGGKPGWHGGGHGHWNGRGSGHWNGRGAGHWNGRGAGHWNGGGRHWNGGGRHWNGGGHGHYARGHGHHWHGWYGGRYYYPGWALGLGVGIGLTYPWWGWGWNYPYAVSYPSNYVVYDRGYEAPVGVVVDRDALPASVPGPAYRWYCPSPQGYHPEVVECAGGWLKVLPPDGGRPSAPLPPRSSVPDGVSPRVAPGTMGDAAPPRIAAPRMSRPAQLADGYAARQTLADSTTR